MNYVLAAILAFGVFLTGMMLGHSVGRENGFKDGVNYACAWFNMMINEMAKTIAPNEMRERMGFDKIEEEEDDT